jgi:hypothetical protein
MKVFRSHRRLTVHVVTEEAGIAKSTCREILTENVGMHRVDVSREPVDRANADDDL